MACLSRLRTFALTGIVFALAAATAIAQAQPPARENALPNGDGRPLRLPESETIRTRVDEVNLVFTVTNSSGKFINKLTLDDFNVLDNRLAPERISYFQQQSGLPLRVALLVDLSDSVTSRFDYEKKAAATFLQQVLRPKIDEALLIGFASEVDLLQDFTSDVGALSRAVQRMKMGGDTRLYDAVKFAAAKLRDGPDVGLSRRAIIVISDGVDTRSSSVMHDAIQAALRAQAVVFALDSNNDLPGEHPAGKTALELITHPSGGSVLQAGGKSEIAQAFRNVGDALRNQYVLGYKPADFQRDGKFRTITILPRLRKLRVQCRRGYFAPREDPAGDASTAAHAGP